MCDGDETGLDWLGRDDLLALDLSPEQVSRLLRDRSAIHRDELPDLLWQLDGDGRTP
jgi:hypothetical protein